MTVANRRFIRTVLLGLAALGALVWMAVDQFGISQGEILGLFLGTLWIAGGAIACAALFTLLWIALRKCLQRQDAD